MLVIQVVLAFVTAGWLAAAPAPEKVFGTAPTLSRVSPLADVLDRPEAYQGGEVLVEGVMSTVCKKKGCWMILSDGRKTTRVTFKDYGFFLPKDSAGQRVRAQGVVLREVLPVKTVRHYLKDEGASRAEIHKVKEPVATVSFVASGVVFLASK